MGYRGLMDKNGELFGYLYGGTLYTLDDEPTGRVEGDYIVDMEGNRIWRLHGDGVYTLEDFEPVGYFGEERPDDYEF